MPNSLEIDYAFRTEAGLKEHNDDCCDVGIPDGHLLTSKGIAAAIADGVSSSEGGGQASQVCVKGFLNDYFSTPESWTVRTSSAKVLGALNQWLCGQGQLLYDSAMGMVTTFSAVVIKSTTVHVVHIGDSRIYRYRDGELSLLTRDHRVWVSRSKEFLSRAMGADPHVEIDYRGEPGQPEDIYLFTTDGIHDFLTKPRITAILAQNSGNLQACANQLVDEAMRGGSNDNVTCQLLKVISLAQETEDDVIRQVADLPFPPPLSPGVQLDQYRILRELHASNRSEVFLALDTETNRQVALKTPSVNYRDDPAFLDHFLHEEWVASNIDHGNILKTYRPGKRRYLYNVSEYIPGQSLQQWMHDHGPASLSDTRRFTKQLISALRCLHRKEILHQDLKPGNVLIDPDGLLKLIDFGGAYAAGRNEISTDFERDIPQGTLDYAAPEALAGVAASPLQDIYSLGVIVYELLTGKLPYGEIEQYNPKRRYHYRPAHSANTGLPRWLDSVLSKAVHPDPRKRYSSMSEFWHDLNSGNEKSTAISGQPLLERHPLLFWQTLSFVLVVMNLILLWMLSK